MSPMPWLDPARSTMAALQARGVHALLLQGPAGIGKWDLALSFARDVLCEQAVPPAPACGQCPSCQLFAAGNHPDLRVVVPDALAHRRPGGAQGEDQGEAAEADRDEPKGTKRVSREIRIDQVRELEDLWTLTAHRGGWRIVALGPAEALNPAAANALLKSLEEPPERSIFLLTTDQLDHCLPTIISRCALVRVAPPARATALQWLQAQGMAAAQAQERLTQSAGAPLRALEPLDEEQAQAMAVLLGLLRRGAALTAADVAAAVPRTIAVGPAADLFQRWGWDYFSFRLGGSLRYHVADQGAFTALGPRWQTAAVAQWLRSARSLKALAEHPLNARLAVEALLLEYIASIAGEEAAGAA